jgi:transcriptional regulator with XRE-family HTH domain
MSYHANRRAVFAACLKTARRKSGLSASKAAQLLQSHGLACTRGTLLAWERGQGPTSREPFASDLSIIALVYGCGIEALFDCNGAAEWGAPRQGGADGPIEMPTA